MTLAGMESLQSVLNNCLLVQKSFLKEGLYLAGVIFFFKCNMAVGTIQSMLLKPLVFPFSLKIPSIVESENSIEIA